MSDIERADILLSVNGSVKQQSNIKNLINTIPELIHHISEAWELQQGDLIYTGTPEGVGAVVVGDQLVCSITGLQDLKLAIV